MTKDFKIKTTNTKMHKVLVVVFAGLLACEVYAQQIPLFNAALINPFIENPALAGENKFSQGFLDYRNQWVDIEGAPESALLTIDWPLNDEKSGLGIILSSDHTNILGHMGLLTGYSHNIKLGADQNLRLGLALKINHNTIYFDKMNAEVPDETIFLNYFEESASGLNANFGIAYRFKGLSAGISASNLINSKLKYINEIDEKKLYFQYIPQYLININYTYGITSDISIRPEVALRDLQGMPAQYEANILATYANKYSAGVIYRNKNSIGVLVSALIYDRLTMAYSYQSALGDLKGFGGSTHEITFGYRFYTSHFQEYKPIDEDKINELLDFAQKQAEDNKDLKETNDKLRKQQEQLNELLKNEKEEVNKLKETMLLERENNEQARMEDETTFDNLSDDKLKDPTQPIYIILGVFSNIYSAKEYQQSLIRDYKIGTEVLKRKNNQDYIVCVNKKFASKAELQKELTRLRKITGKYNSTDVWIYVNE